MMDKTGNLPVWLVSVFAGAGIGSVDGPLPVGDVIGLVVVAAGIIYSALPKPQSTTHITKITPIKPKKSPEEEKKPNYVPVPQPNAEKKTTSKKSDLPTYYHATSSENAVLIAMSGILHGSTFESGYVFAWKSIPTKKALEMSGARYAEVVISFQTNASFIDDTGITDKYVRSFGPLVSLTSNKVGVANVQLVRRYY